MNESNSQLASVVGRRYEAKKRARRLEGIDANIVDAEWNIWRRGQSVGLSESDK